MQTDIIYCSVCGEAMGDTAYYDAAGQLVGCENCITAKDPYR